MATTRASAGRTGRSQLGTATVASTVLGVALVAWIVTAVRMEGMDAGPGTALGELGWYVGAWVTMMAAMMLPSALPMALVFHRVVQRSAPRGVAPTAWFVAGYLATWTAYGLGAYGLWRLVGRVDWAWLGWAQNGPYVAGAAVAAAGVYELTPLKRLCLRHCRSPLHFVLHRWRRGMAGAVRMGIEHGAWCVGCCGGLMVVLFAVGVMSLFWMVVVAAAIFVEKVLPWEGTGTVMAVALVGLGAWIAIDPGSVPLLTEPVGSEMGGMAGM